MYTSWNESLRPSVVVYRLIFKSTIIFVILDIFSKQIFYSKEERQL